MNIRIISLLPLLLTGIIALAQNPGETSFKQICAACHTIGKGRLVGPDLANIDQRHPEEWIIRFVKSSQTVIKGGDKYADSLFRAYNQVPMPDRPDLSDEQIKEIITYIKTNSPAFIATAPAAAAATAAPVEQATTTMVTGDITKGKDLFIGNIRFSNNGPTCNSCHNVEKAGIISGGALAKDLTDVAARMNAEGIKAIISAMPFPAMQQSFKNKPLTEEEIINITAFLNSPPEKEEVAGSNEATILFWGGVLSVGALLILFPLFWIKRKQRTVNYAIYERQIKSL